jgi:hypothetical protein
MMRWLSIGDRGVLTLIAGLSVAAATPAPAQQAAGSGAPAVAGSADRVVPNLVAEARAAGTTPTAARPGASPGAVAEARAAQAGSPGAPLLGPQLRPQVPRVEPRIARRTPAWPAAPAPDNTIVISTLALVLIAVIVTILVLD